jgi:ferrous iron transport protein B
VTRAEGGYQFNSVKYKLVDLPGTYSLLSASQDEEVARDFILFGQPDCTIVVTDATALERNLNLVLQVMEITTHVVVAVNLMDEARRKGIEVDTRSLSRDLGIPAIPVTARTGEGVHTLLATVAEVIEGLVAVKPLRVTGTPEFQKAVNELVPMIEQMAPGIPNARWLAIRLLDGDARVQKALSSGELADIVGRQTRADVSFSKKMSVEGRQ